MKNLLLFLLSILFPFNSQAILLNGWDRPSWLPDRPAWLIPDETSADGDADHCSVNERRCGIADTGWIMFLVSEEEECEEICSMAPSLRLSQGYLYGLCQDPSTTVSSGVTNDDPHLGPVTYVPGKATVYEHGLVLSEGLTSRVIAEAGRPVQFDVSVENEMESLDVFHNVPDGAAVFADTETGGWKYVSNSEDSNGNGGVGVITFDFAGRVIGYERVLTGTSKNCGGGKTPWKTWMSGEEFAGGRVWEVDPWNHYPPRPTMLGYPDHEGYWESAAYDQRDPTKPVFYVTADYQNTPLLRFTPDAAAVLSAIETNDYSKLLHSPGKNEYLKLNFRKKTFEWTTNYAAASRSAMLFYPNAEGIGTFVAWTG